MVTGWAAVAPHAASLRAVMSGRRSGSATMSVSGRISMSSGSWPSSRVIAPEADSRSPVADTSMMTDPTLCTSDRKRASRPLANSKRRRLVRSRRHNSTRFLPERRRGVPTISTSRHPVTDSDADLNGVADVLVLNGCERAKHELVVVRVHQVEAGDADGVGQRSSEQLLRRRVAPGDVAVLVDDDDAVGQLQHGAGQRGHVLHGRSGLARRGPRRTGLRRRSVRHAGVITACASADRPRPFSRHGISLLSDNWDCRVGCNLVAQARRTARCGDHGFRQRSMPVRRDARRQRDWSPLHEGVVGNGNGERRESRHRVVPPQRLFDPVGRSASPPACGRDGHGRSRRPRTATACRPPEHRWGWRSPRARSRCPLPARGPPPG